MAPNNFCFSVQWFQKRSKDWLPILKCIFIIFFPRYRKHGSVQHSLGENTWVQCLNFGICYCHDLCQLGQFKCTFNRYHVLLVLPLSSKTTEPQAEVTCSHDTNWNLQFLYPGALISKIHPHCSYKSTERIIHLFCDDMVIFCYSDRISLKNKWKR